MKYLNETGINKFISLIKSSLKSKQDNINQLVLTLPVASWSNNTLTIAADGVTTSNIVWISPSPASHNAYCEAGIRCTAQAANKLTFTCESVPTAALTVNVAIG